MFDLRRFVSLAIVGACLACAMVVVDVTLALACGPEPIWLADPHPLDWNYYQLFGSYVAGAEYERAQSPATAPRDYGLLVGASTIERGPVPALVLKKTGIPWLLLGVGGGTGAFSKLRRSIPVIREAKLTPKAILLGIHPMWLSDMHAGAHPRTSVTDRSWSVRESKLVTNLVYARLQAAREALLRGPGRGTWGAFAPARTPWTPEPEAPYTEPLSEKDRAEHRRLNKLAGRFDPDTYRDDGEAVREMVAAVRELVEIQPDVTVVFLPEHSKYRIQVPEVAVTVLRNALARAFPDHPIRITDIRDSLPDEWFFDNYHLTMNGRRALSDRLADVYLGTEAPGNEKPRRSR